MVRDLQASHARHAADDAIQVVTHAMREVVEVQLMEHYGRDWPRQFPDEHHRPFPREDFLAYARELLTGEQREAMRACFPVPIHQWDRPLQRVREHRNHTLIHADRPLTVEDAQRVVADCLRLTKDARLNCAGDLKDILGQLSRGIDMRAPDPRELEDLHRQVAQYAAEIQRKDAQLHESEIALAAIDDQRHAAEVERDEARGRRDDVDRQIAELQARLGDVSARSESERQALTVELQALQSDRDAAQVAAKRQSRLLKEATERQRQAERDAEVARIAEEEARSRADNLAAELSARESVTEISPTAASEPVPIGPDLQAMIQRLEGAIAARADVQDEGLPQPGQPWPYPRGREVWRLSKVHHKLTRVIDDADVSVLVGTATASRVIEGFLSIRPTGGRVWVDVDGDACTFVDGHLVFLGRLEPESEELDPPSGAPRVGLPMGEVHGRRYTLGRGGITCKATDKDLKEVIGAQNANRVRDRFLTIKPKGGALRVAADGTAALFVDGQWVYAGRVNAREWFPGHISS